MNRSAIFEACVTHLSVLCTRVELAGKLNILNLHVHCEDFYCQLFNKLYPLKLANMNANVQNVEGIDLIDSIAEVIVQVSSTATRQKVNSALGKNLAAYQGYSFRFVSISKDATHLRALDYINPHKLVFDPANDIYDVSSLLQVILHMELPRQREIYDFLRDELSEPGSERLKEESNLASVINSIAKQDLDGSLLDTTNANFNVDEKVALNDLHAAAGVIEDYKVYHHIVDRIYAEFDANGVNKSKSVLEAFRMAYFRLSAKFSGDALFFRITEDMVEKVRESSNFARIPIDELNLCVTVLAVDAFIRCKIFKRPSGVTHVAA